MQILLRCFGSFVFYNLLISTAAGRVSRGSALDIGFLRNVAAEAATDEAIADASASGQKKRRILSEPDETNADASPSAEETPPSQADTMPSLFSAADELKYDRYAACLAATEGLRRARDEAESTGGSKFRSLLGQGKAKKVEEENDEEYKRAQAQYVLNSGKVIRALGLTVSQFNQLGREVSNNPILKEKVMEQAYLYRMAATLNMQKIPLIEDPTSERLLKAHRRRRVQMFARSMTEIEELRSEQQERLKRALNVERLPEGINICDPAILPILSPKVRAVCEAFPLQAEEIVKKYGLNSDEFNKMLDETRGNPVFRWRVKKYMGKTELESS